MSAMVMSSIWSLGSGSWPTRICRARSMRSLVSLVSTVRKLSHEVFVQRDVVLDVVEDEPDLLRAERFDHVEAEPAIGGEAGVLPFVHEVEEVAVADQGDEKLAQLGHLRRVHAL